MRPAPDNDPAARVNDTPLDESDLNTWRSNRAARPKNLTDMDLPEYSVSDMKEQYRTERRSHRRRMRE